MGSYDFDYVIDFTGGMNCFDAPDDLASNQTLWFANADPIGMGGFRRRSGIEVYKEIGATPLDRIIEFEYRSQGTSVLKRFALTGGKLIDSDTNNTILEGLNNLISYVVYKNKLYMLSNGFFKVYDGVAFSDVTNTNTDSNLPAIQKCRCIEQYGNRAFACGNPDDPTALYYSELGDFTYWKVINIVQAISDDSDILTGLKEFHGALVAFKRRGVYAWTGFDPTKDVMFNRLSVQSGTNAFRTIQRVNDTLLYLGDDGVYQLLGTYKDVIASRKISKNIQPLIKEISKQSDPFNDTSCAVVYDGKYMLSVATSFTNANNIVFVCFTDFLTDNNTCWGVYTGWFISDFLYSKDGNLYSTSNLGGIIQLHNEQDYSDLGAGIDVRVEVRPLHENKPVHLKKYRYGYAWLQQFEETTSHIDISCAVDYIQIDNSIDPNDSLIWDDPLRGWDKSKWDFVDLVTRHFHVGKKGKRLTVTMQDLTPDEKLVFYGFCIEYKDKKPSKD